MENKPSSLLKNIFSRGLVASALLILSIVFPKIANAGVNQSPGAQQVSDLKTELKGNVYDKYGPVSGAGIIVKGTKQGTVTDINGNFTLLL